MTCSNDNSGPPASLIVELIDTGTADGAIVSAHVRKGNRASSTSDGSEGDGQPSPRVYVNGGAGVYDVYVTKAGASGQDYTLSYHCVTGPNGSGIHTGSSLTTRQNQ